MAAKLCMMCNAPLDGNGDCATVNCIYNPNEDAKVHEAEFEYVEGRGDTGSDEETLDFDFAGMSEEEMRELLDDGSDDDPEDLTEEEKDELANEGKGEREAPKAETKPKDDNLDSKINQDADDADDRMGGGDEGDMDTEDVEAEEEPEKGDDEKFYDDDAPDDLDGPDESHDENDAEDEKGQLDELPDDLPEQKPESEKQLTEEDKGEDPSDDAHDLPQDDPEEDGLPPRPQGCSGDCKPTDDPGGDDAEPCPHCTAKQFREQMQNEGKENLPEEQMESEWQDFLDNWENEAEHNQKSEPEPEDSEEEPDDAGDERYDEPDEDYEQERKGQGGEGDGDGKPDDDYVPDPEDDDLPPKPQGCKGSCEENEDPDGDGEPCPHCTAKRFKESMRDELDEGKREEVPSPEELAEMFQQMLEDQRQKMQGENDSEAEAEESDEPDEAEPEDSEPPEDELSDDEPDEDNEDREQNNDDPDDEDEGDSEKLGEQKDGEKPKRPDFKRMASDLTITQEKRFDNLVQRLQKKVEGTFGNTAEDVYVMPKAEGQFQGEDLSQAIQIRSRGVLYWCTLSAAKAPEND